MLLYTYAQVKCSKMCIDRLYQISGGWWRHLPGWALLPPLDRPPLNRPFGSDIVQRKFPFRQTFVQFIPYLWYNGENVLFVKLLLLGSTPYLWIRGIKKWLAFSRPDATPFEHFDTSWMFLSFLSPCWGIFYSSGHCEAYHTHFLMGLKCLERSIALIFISLSMLAPLWGNIATLETS